MPPMPYTPSGHARALIILVFTRKFLKEVKRLWTRILIHIIVTIKFYNYSYEIVSPIVIVNSYKNGQNCYQIVKNTIYF